MHRCDENTFLYTILEKLISSTLNFLLQIEMYAFYYFNSKYLFKELPFGNIDSMLSTDGQVVLLKYCSLSMFHLEENKKHQK